MTRRPARRAFLLLDLTTAILIAGAVILSLTVAVGHFRRAERNLAKQRAAARHLDHALLTLQTAAPATPDIRIETLPDPAPPGKVWVRVSSPSAGKQTLVGLTSQKSPGGAP